jgi:hypothetical protein
MLCTLATGNALGLPSLSQRGTEDSEANVQQTMGQEVEFH